jgi:hypothetical protein
MPCSVNSESAKLICRSADLDTGQPSSFFVDPARCRFSALI